MAAYAALDLIAAIKNPSPATLWFVGDAQLRTLTKLANIFVTSVQSKLLPSNAASPRVGNNKPLEFSEKPRVPIEKPRVDNNDTNCYNLRSHKSNYIATVKDFNTDVAKNIMNNDFTYKCYDTFTEFPTNDPYDYEMNTSSELFNAIFNPDTG